MEEKSDNISSFFDGPQKMILSLDIPSRPSSEKTRTRTLSKHSSRAHSFESFQAEPKQNPGKWNQNVENATRDIGEKSRSYKLMHTTAAQEASKNYNIFSILNLIVGPIGGFLSGVGAMDTEKQTYPIIVAVLGFLGGTIGAILRFGKYDSISNAHKTAASKYTSLEYNTTRQLVLHEDDRISSKEYLEYIGNTFDQLFVSAPLLPTHIYNKFIIDSDINEHTIPEANNENIVTKKDSPSGNVEINEDSKKNQREFSDPLMNYQMKRMKMLMGS